MHEQFVHVDPFLHSPAVVNLRRYVHEALLISGLCHFRHYFLLVYVLFEGEQDLAWVDWLYQIVGNLRSYCLVHDVFLLALCHHHYRCGRQNLLYLLQRFQSAYSRHHFVEQYEVEVVS